MESSKETGCRAPEDPVLCINDCDVFAAFNKNVVCRSSSSDESELALAGAAVASADFASHISQVNSKEGLKKCTACHKHVGLTGFSCKCGDLFYAVHHYSDKHNCPFDYRNAGQNAIAKANPIIVAEKLNKI
ncbi:zinc finger A20 and AN1 domain-containing stress-associated protein 8-like [Capsicum annuum]